MVLSHFSLNDLPCDGHNARRYSTSLRHRLTEMGLYKAIKDLLSVAEWRKRLAEVEAAYVRLTDENAQLREELAKLHKQKQTPEMHYQDNVYWRRIIENRIEGPFCPKCFDNQEKTIGMSDYSSWFAWICPVCQCIIRKPTGYGLKLGEGSIKPDQAR
jgi:rubrerythrin